MISEYRSSQLTRIYVSYYIVTLLFFPTYQVFVSSLSLMKIEIIQSKEQRLRKKIKIEDNNKIQVPG